MIMGLERFVQRNQELKKIPKVIIQRMREQTYKNKETRII